MSKAVSLDDQLFGGVLGCFALSGFAGLLYQTAWLRQFSLVFGTSELAVATVLACYMAGLAAGSAIAARCVSRVRRPVLTYGLLELGVALGALAVPFALMLLRRIQAVVLGGQANPPDAGGLTSSLFYLLGAFLLLALPTGCMGATLPMLTRYAVRRRDQIGSRVGLLYAINTGGAVCGTLATAFVLLPTVGLWATLVVGALVNLVVFAIAVVISRWATDWGEPSCRSVPEPQAGGVENASRAVGQPAELGAAARGLLPPGWVLPIMLVSGATSFTYEVLWTRLLSHLLGGSIFAFATMLASFLSGITIGSAFASRLARDRDSSARGLAASQFGTALLSIAIYYVLAFLPTIGMAVAVGEHSSLLAQAGLSAALLLPATLCIGATFPFAVRILARDESEAARASARVYAWNTVGAIGGAVLAAFWLLPALKFAGVARLAVAVNVLLCGAALLLESPLARGRLAALAVAGAIILLVFQPRGPEAIVRTSPLAGKDLSQDWQAGELLFYEVGRSATVLVLERHDEFHLRSNGLPEAVISRRGAMPWMEVGRLMTALPVLARPEARDLLLVGFGGGVALSGVPPSVRRIDAIELEPKIIAANRRIAGLRSHNPLADPRLRLILNDARGALALTDKRYDVIVSQPSHPWTAGASHLYTVQFMRLAREHLRPGGVFLQWMSADFIDAPLLKTLGATLLAVFPQVELYMPYPNLLFFLASDQPIEPEKTLAGPLSAACRQHYRLLGLGSPEDLIALLMLDREGLAELCGTAPVNTDGFNRIALRAPRALRHPLGGPNACQMMRPYDPLLRPDATMDQFGLPAVDQAYLVRRLFAMAFRQRAGRLAESIRGLSDRLLAIAWLSERAEAVEILQHLLELDPGNQNGRFALLLYQRRQLAAGTAGPQARAQAGRLHGAAGAVVRGWRLAQQEKWTALAGLEDELAEARPRDLWYTWAIHLRVLWRTRLPASAERRRELAEQALAILDGAWGLAPELHHTSRVVRIEAARLADRPEVVLDTARRLALSRQQPAGSSPSEREEERQSLLKVLQYVEQLRDDPRVSRRRVEQVAALLDKALGELVYASGRKPGQ